MEKRYLYRVKPEYDGKRIDYIRYHQHVVDYVIADELYTYEQYHAHNIPRHWLEGGTYETDTLYWCFGARFSTKHPYVYRGPNA